MREVSSHIQQPQRVLLKTRKKKMFRSPDFSGGFCSTHLLHPSLRACTYDTAKSVGRNEASRNSAIISILLGKNTRQGEKK